MKKKRFYNECLIFFIQQLRHDDGCAINLFSFWNFPFNVSSTLLDSQTKKHRTNEEIEIANGNVVFLSASFFYC